MTRHALDNGNWFDDSTAITFDEGRTWNGNNHISNATGSQWHHECLYYTASGNWVLHAWSQMQGDGESYAVIDEADAITWLIAQECWDVDELPDAVRLAVESAIELAEI